MQATSGKELIDTINMDNIRTVELTEDERIYYNNIADESLKFGDLLTEQNTKTESFYVGFSH